MNKITETRVVRSKEDVIDDLTTFLKKLSTKRGTIVQISKLADDEGVPYKGNIASSLVNMGFTKYVSLGKYQVLDFEANKFIAEAVRTDCINQSKATKKQRIKDVDTIAAREQLPPVNPFGFTMFDTIMVTDGKIEFGDYVMEGSFTITKKKPIIIDINDTASG